MEESDLALRQAAVKGDRAAVETLFRTAYPAVYGFCLHLSRDPRAAEDLAQQTFLLAFRHLRSYRPELPMKPWLLRIAHNAGVSALRGKHPQVTLEDPQVQAMASPARSPEETAMAGEMRAQVQAALARLTPELRAVIVLRYQQELSYEEIARAIAKPITTVTSRLWEARRQLGRFLGPMANENEGGAHALQPLRP